MGIPLTPFPITLRFFGAGKRTGLVLGGSLLMPNAVIEVRQNSQPLFSNRLRVIVVQSIRLWTIRHPPILDLLQVYAMSGSTPNLIIS
ncbi:MAG: hypothetical protein R3E32_28210 [Chitinophagales bacterium]